jgi:cytochrome b561
VSAVAGPRPAARYTLTASVLHWVVAALVIGMIGFGWWMQGIAKTPVGPRVNAYNLHKSIGMVVLLLMCGRVLWRATHPPPGLPPMPLWQARAARGVHLLLYVCLFVQPLTGYLGSAYSGYPVKFFGVTLPAWAGADAAVKDAMSAIHLGNSWVLVAALLLHLAGTLKHALIDRDGSFRRIWPWFAPAREHAGEPAGD